MTDSTAWFVTAAARSQVGALVRTRIRPHRFWAIAAFGLSGQRRPTRQDRPCRPPNGNRWQPAESSDRRLSRQRRHRVRGAARPQWCATPSRVVGRSIALEIVVAADTGRHERLFVTMPPASCRESSRFLGVDKSL
jgi:hypothetical protein